jgi:hypothetical protein
LPESSLKELNEAKVLAVGPGALDKKGNRIAMSVAVGDKVLIPQVSLSCIVSETTIPLRKKIERGREGEWKERKKQLTILLHLSVWRKSCEARRRGVFYIPGP